MSLRPATRVHLDPYLNVCSTLVNNFFTKNENISWYDSSMELRLHPFPYDEFQQTAIDAVEAGSSLLVAAPTGSGKTVIAEYPIALAFERHERDIYTAPVKALSNQKYRDFRAR